MFITSCNRPLRWFKQSMPKTHVHYQRDELACLSSAKARRPELEECSKPGSRINLRGQPYGRQKPYQAIWVLIDNRWRISPKVLLGPWYASILYGGKIIRDGKQMLLLWWHLIKSNVGILQSFSYDEPHTARPWREIWIDCPFFGWNYDQISIFAIFLSCRMIKIVRAWK